MKHEIAVTDFSSLNTKEKIEREMLNTEMAWKGSTITRAWKTYRSNVRLLKHPTDNRYLLHEN